jgi:hypothetical protein
MNGSSSARIEIDEGVGEINNMFQNDCALCRLMSLENSHDAVRSRLEEAEALQLAAALASVRQNVSEAGQ